MGNVFTKQWAITGPHTTVIYGLADASSRTEALRAAGQDSRVLFGVTTIDPIVELSAWPADDLADGAWREVGPGAVRAGRDNIVDRQISDTFGRRFALRRSGMWQVADVNFFVAMLPGLYLSAMPPADRTIQRHIRVVLCGDLRDVRGLTNGRDWSREEMVASGAAGDDVRVTAARRMAEGFAWDDQLNELMWAAGL